jgi:hypothetical protein
MAGASHKTKALYPQGSDSYFPIRVGGWVNQGAAANTVIDTFTLDCDCHIRKVDLSYAISPTAGAAHLDGVGLKTLDDGKNIVDSSDMSAAVVGVAQTINSTDITTATVIVRGDKIQAYADSAGTNEAGYVCFTVWLEPAFS